MKFSEVPFEIQVHIQQLTRDKVFQKRFAEDEVLDQLDQLKYDPVIEYNQIQLLLHNKLKFFGLQFEPMTLGLWAYLYTIKSPLVFEQQKATTLDADVFFYLLETKNYTLPLDELINLSINYTKDVLNFTKEQTQQVIQKLFKISFRVLNMFPRLKLDKQAVFNADWITSIVTKVSQVSSYSTQELYKKIPICEVYYLFAQYCREKGSEAIFLRTEEEILAEQDLRATTLVVERLIELGHINESNKEYYIKLIHNIGV